MSGSDAFIWRHLRLPRHCISEALLHSSASCLMEVFLLDLQSSHNQPRNARLIVFVYAERARRTTPSPQALAAGRTRAASQAKRRPLKSRRFGKSLKVFDGVPLMYLAARRRGKKTKGARFHKPPSRRTSPLPMVRFWLQPFLKTNGCMFYWSGG